MSEFGVNDSWKHESNLPGNNDLNCWWWNGVGDFPSTLWAPSWVLIPQGAYVLRAASNKITCSWWRILLFKWEKKKRSLPSYFTTLLLKSLCVKEKVVLLQAVTSQKQQFTSSLTDQCFYWGAAMIRSQKSHCYKSPTMYNFFRRFPDK